jgi:hypothetical protein
MTVSPAYIAVCNPVDVKPQATMTVLGPVPVDVVVPIVDVAGMQIPLRHEPPFMHVVPFASGRPI